MTTGVSYRGFRWLLVRAERAAILTMLIPQQVERAGAVGVVQIAMRGAGSVSTDRLWTQPGRSPLAAGHDNATLFG